MADQKVSADSLVTPYAADYFPFVTASGPTSNRVYWETMMNGWIEVNDTWAYASATTITVPTNATTRYNKGNKIRIKQGGSYKYFYIVSVAATVLTVTGGTDYTVANSAISNIAYSKVESPLDFPTSFNYTATVSGSGGSIGTYAETNSGVYFSVVGKKAIVTVTKTITNKGSWSGDLRVVLPFTATSPLNGGNPNFFPSCAVIANGALTIRGYGCLYASDTYIRFQKSIGTAFLDWADLSTNDWICISFEYPI